MWKFQGIIKKRNGTFRCIQEIKIYLDFTWVLFLGISKKFHTVLQNFEGCKLVFCKISKGKVTNLKYPVEILRKVYAEPPFGFFLE